jgi:hypothetical protein
MSFAAIFFPGFYYRWANRSLNLLEVSIGFKLNTFAQPRSSAPATAGHPNRGAGDG